MALCNVESGDRKASLQSEYSCSKTVFVLIHS